ncbi:hypothetical protein ABZX75_26285 [Streptomyces sp. NPDC003038]|uniref:hypothetical protein n=1 Tax=unclassified Streptomyces TaxID=2593676 RepID=UPI0033ABE3D5
MGDTSARDLLAEELRNLRASAGLSLARIEEQGKKQPRVVRLGKSKLSSWLAGVAVPEADAPFRFLIQLLESRASRSGVPSKGLPWWLDLRQKAANERSALKAATPAVGRAPSATENRISDGAVGTFTEPASNNSNLFEVLVCAVEWIDPSSPSVSPERRLQDVVTSVLGKMSRGGSKSLSPRE